MGYLLKICSLIRVCLKHTFWRPVHLAERMFQTRSGKLTGSRFPGLHFPEDRDQGKTENHKNNDDSNRPGEEVRGQAAFRLSDNQGTPEIRFQNVGQYNTQHERSRFKAVNLHQIAKEAENQHDYNFIHAVGQGIRTDAGESHDNRNQHRVWRQTDTRHLFRHGDSNDSHQNICK